MADPTSNIISVTLPGAGQTQTYALTAGSTVKFTFDIAEAIFTGTNGNLEIAIEGGGTVILENYQELAESGTLPTFETIEGEQVAGDVYLFAFEDTEETAEDIETAADGAAGGSGAGEYSDDPGSLVDAIDALGGQEDAYATRTLLQIEGVLGNDAPIAANDIGDDALEAGDHDLVPGMYVNWVYPNFDEYQGEGFDARTDGGLVLTQEFLHDNLIGWDPDHVFDLDAAAYFPLSGGEGGILIYNPNPPQEPYEVEGNVTDNDFDPNGDPISMNTIDFLDDDHFGNNPDPQAVSGPTVVNGKYGVLVIEPDGSYTYTLNQDWTDILDEGDSYDEVFEYSVVDSQGAVSNTATLTITVFGSNDMPVANADFNVEAVEDGSSTGYVLDDDGNPISVYDSDLNDGEGGNVIIHDDEDHDYTAAVNTSGNVLVGDDAGGVTDTDPDESDQAGDGTLFVVGVYSHHTQTVDYAVPGEAGTPPPDHGPAMHPDQAWDEATPGATSYSVAGNYGVLTIAADGGYTYTLYNEAAFDNGDYQNLEGAQGFKTFDDLASNLNTLNYDNDGQEDFTYGIMDDSGAFNYATISFTVNGANDAPVAIDNVATAVEFGAMHYAPYDYPQFSEEEIDAISTVEGNVIANDTDVDDTDIFVADVYTKVESDDGLVRDPSNTFDVFNDTDTSDGTAAQQVVIQGQYGTLTIDHEGNYTYVADNSLDAVNNLNTGESLTETFWYTARNDYDDGVISNEAKLEITIDGTNDAPTDADFFVAGDFGADGGILIPFSQFDDNITDPEDDRSGTDTWDSSFRIESLPEGGTLYYDGNEVQIGEVYDLDDPIGQFTYVPDADTQKGVLIGSREQDDAGLSTWGDKVNNQTREIKLDLDDDGTDDVTITTSIDSNKLQVFNHQGNHIGHGLGNKTHSGIDMGETLSVDFNGTAVAYAEIGFDGLGNYFNPGSQQDAHATWVAYNGSEVVAWGMVNNDQMFVGTGDVPTDHAGWQTASMVSNVPDGVSGNQGDLFQSFVLDQSVLNGAVFDRLEFGTTEQGPRDWNSNWELRYVDVEFAGDHTFTYTAVDSNGQDDTGIHDGPATVTILPDGPFNEAPEATPDLLVTNEDAPPSHGSVAVNDVDFDDTSHELTFVLKDPAPEGLTFNDDGTYTFDPSSYQYLGLDDDPLEFVLNYEVYDNGVPVKTDDTTLTIVVEPRNDAPTLDLSADATEITFVSQNAGYVNMLGVYHLVNGQLVNPEIIITDSKDVQSGELLATYEADDNFGFFLISNGGNQNLPTGDMEFVQHPDGTWGLTIGGQYVDVQFDYSGYNPAGEEPTFQVQPQPDGSWRVEVDDQLRRNDDDDFDDLIVEVDPGVSGLDYAAVYTENDPPISITGEVDIDDIDNGAAISQATITYMPVDDNDVITFPDGWTVTTTTDPGTGEVTFVITPESGIGTYEDILEGITFSNTSDVPVGGDRVFTITVTDNEGAESNPATSTITVNPVNDPPVAGNDFYHEIFVQPESTEVVTTEATVGGKNGWPGANNQQSVDLGDIEIWASPMFMPDPPDFLKPLFTLVATGNSPHLSIQGPGENNNNPDIDFIEQINLGFDDPQTDVTVNLGHLNAGGRRDSADTITFVIHEADSTVREEVFVIGPDAGQHSPSDPSFEFTSATGITMIEIRPDFLSQTEFTLMSVDYTSTQTVTTEGAIYYDDIYEDDGPHGDGLVGSAEGNVLSNDYDIDSNPLEVLSAKVAGGSWTTVDAEEGDAQGTLISGEYGDLHIYENGEFSYELRPEVLELDEVPSSETFEYRVTDLDGGTDTATLTFQIHDMSDPNFVKGTPDGDTLHGDADNNSIFGLAGDDTLYGHAGSDLISGGSGDDMIYGQGGRDTLYGGAGDDTIRGGTGRDTIWGGDGDDTIYGGGGDDKIFVSEGADVIHVANGSDIIVIDPAYIGEGGANATVINFESGSDLLKLGDLTGKEISVDEVNDDLRITVTNPGGGTNEGDIVVTLEGVNIDQFNGGVDISDNNELNQMIQSIVDSGNSTI